jgi:hypothetical protein
MELDESSSASKEGPLIEKFIPEVPPEWQGQTTARGFFV